VSRGPGRVERAITLAFSAEPTRIFTTEDLCRQVYRHLPEIKKKHRVALIRAARKVLQRDPNWRAARTRFPGAPLVFFNKSRVKQIPDLEGLLSGDEMGWDSERDI
jgi:hypothetical protein